MRRACAILGIAALLHGAASWPAHADAPTAARAEAALAELTRAFWVGRPADGHLRSSSVTKGKDIGGWGEAQAVAAYYGAWRYLGDAKAGQMVAAEWAWMKNGSPKPADLVACGPGVRFNFASDDTAWDVGLYLQAYDVTHDPAALTAAEGSLDCAWRTWWDDALGGGYWYDQRHSDKTMYQAVLTLDCEWLFRLTGAKRFHERAIASEKWAAMRLGRDDGLYWKSVHLDGKLPEGRYLIEPTRSVTMIVGNMAQAVAEIWLNQDTGQAVYLQRAQATAAAILKYEVDRNGVLINDQDGDTDGWAMVPFAREVLPRLQPPQRDAWTKTLRTSAAAIWQVDHHADGTFGADWDGPLEGGAWVHNVHTPTPPTKVSVSGGAVNLIVAAAIQ